MSEGYKLYGGNGVEIEPLEVSEDGTYTAPMGKAFNPVKVSGGGSTGGGVLSISLTWDDAAQAYLMDKTAGEVLAAANAGKMLITFDGQIDTSAPEENASITISYIATVEYLDGAYQFSDTTGLVFTAATLDDFPSAGG